MSSEAKIDANRRNAQRSTGPTTPAGKARSATNAIRHGLTATRVLVPGEDATAFAEFCADYRTALAPSGALEATLVDEITADSWRLGRIPWIEAGILRQQMLAAGRALAVRRRGPAAILAQNLGIVHDDEELPPPGPDDLGQAFRAINENKQVVTDHIDRHQARLARRRDHNLKLLVTLQTRRLRAAAAADDAVDADADPTDASPVPTVDASPVDAAVPPDTEAREDGRDDGADAAAPPEEAAVQNEPTAEAEPLATSLATAAEGEPALTAPV
jgi:hypothetical protein